MRKILDDRDVKYGLNSLVLVIVVVLIAVLLNLIVKQNPIKIDLTANKLYSIGNTTKTIIGKVNNDVTIYALFDDGKIDEDYKGIKDLLNQYVNNSNKHITVKYIDPDKNVKIVKQLDPEGVLEIKKNDFIVISGDKKKKLSYEDLFQVKVNQQSFSQYTTGSLAEQSFTSAINYVTSNITPTVYFVKNNGEDNLQSNYKTFKSILENNNYIIKSLDLGVSQSIPKDAEILVFLYPKKDLSTNERDIIQKYLNNGGKIIFSFDFLASEPRFPQFEKVIKEYNLSINYDRVKENNEMRHLPGNPYSLILDVENSEVIPLEFSGMLMSDSRSINILKNENNKIKIVPLIKTGDSAVGDQIDNGQGTNSKGPMNLAVAVENKNTDKPSQIVVLGSSEAVTENSKQQNSTYFSPSTYFFVSVFNWMQDKKSDVIIGVKDYQNGKISISEFNSKIIGIVVIVIIPVSILAVGISVLNKRRNL